MYQKMLLVLTALVLGCSGSVTGGETEQWDIFELALKGPSDGNPFVDVQLSAEFRQDHKVFKPDGFYDGNGIYRVRFMPNATGMWTYVTKSNRRELDGNKGEFICTKAGPNNHGPVRAHNTFQLAYADGTPHFSVGTTCYAWVHQGNALEEQTLATLKAAPFNKMRMCVFPKAYAYNNNEPEYYAYEGKPLKDWDFKRFNPVFWHHFEKRVRQLRDMRIEADIIIFHPYDRWGFRSMGHENNLFYLRYLVARLAAYRNVWWSFANEYDFLKWPMEHWDEYFQFVREKDPYNHLRGIHNGRDWYDHSKEWVTHASLQTSNFIAAREYRDKYKKPVVYDECRYEGNIPQGWGNITAEQMTRNFWMGSLAGCYVGHGETYKHPEDLLWWAKGGVLRGQSPARIQYMKDIIEELPYQDMQPDFSNHPDVCILAKPGECYLMYFGGKKEVKLTLPDGRPYKVDGIDTWEMKTLPIGTASAGEFSFTPPKQDYAIRLIRYAPGERLRPEAKAHASVTEGSVPLRVTFSTPSTLKRHWDFGNGETSSAASVTRVYEDVGVHTAKLRVTGEDGASAVAVLTITGLPSEPEDWETLDAWPGSRMGLCFLWKNRAADNTLADGTPCTVAVRPGAAFTADGAMNCNDGAFTALHVDEALLKACRATNQFSIEARITTSSTNQSGPARIVSFSQDTGSRNFTLGQEQNHLVLRLRTPNTGRNALDPQLSLSPLDADAPVHVIVSYFPGHTYCFVNGDRVLSSTAIQGDFSNWEPCHLIFGDEWKGERRWEGVLDSIAIYDRFIGPQEAKRKYKLLMDK
jgi:PKD repeat protein